MSDRWAVHHGDCREVMQAMDAESVDSIVSDPPYGLSFMGKEWDSFKEGDIAMRRNPQMDAVNTGASRQGGRQRACADYQKRQARDMLAFQEAMNAVFLEALRVAKPGCHLLAFGGTRTFHRLTVAIEDAGWEIRDCLMWVYGSGFPKSHNLQGEWQGWGTALKPAWEPIILARKPLSGTVAANVLEHGTGAINVDGCRVGTDAGDEPLKWEHGRGMGFHGAEDRGPCAAGTSPGRWPANLIHDGSDEVVGLFPQTASGSLLPHHKTGTNSGVNVKKAPDEYTKSWGGDSGSAARFFYCAKASKRDRDEGCEGLQEKYNRGSGTHGNGTSTTRLGNAEERANGITHVELEKVRNHHPTVKPTDLMRYLCRLITPPDGLVFDPFTGSGSTGKAAMLEGFRFVGAELSPEYIEIARARIGHAAGKTRQKELALA